MFEYIGLAAFAGLLIYAACSDIARLIIPNWVSLAMTAIFLVVALISAMPLLTIGMHILFAGLVLGVGFFLFQANIIGGGDAKLIAAASLWTGFVASPTFFFWTVVAGGAMALILVVARKLVKQKETNPSFVNHLLKKQNGIPYGVAIMFGGLVTIPSLPILSVPLTLP